MELNLEKDKALGLIHMTPEDNFDYLTYYTKEKNHKRNNIGSGIGLSIVKDVFELHDIKYGVESSEKNGTIFSFVLDKCK